MRPLTVTALVSALAIASANAEEADALRGQEIFLDRDLGHCVLCHQVTALEAPFQGNIGPDLSNVASRLTQEMIRAKVMDPAIDNPDTTMPAYYRTTNLRQVAPEFMGEPILSSAQLEDLLAYLNTLRESR